jgi:hypothetical protein
MINVAWSYCGILANIEFVLFKFTSHYYLKNVHIDVVVLFNQYQVRYRVFGP